jgi:hypothetical protein
VGTERLVGCVATEPATQRQRKYGAAKNSVIVFVDRIFTTFIQPPFTNVFDTIAPIAVTTCLYPVRNAD